MNRFFFLPNATTGASATAGAATNDTTPSRRASCAESDNDGNTTISSSSDGEDSEITAYEFFPSLAHNFGIYVGSFNA